MNILLLNRFLNEFCSETKDLDQKKLSYWGKLNLYHPKINFLLNNFYNLPVEMNNKMTYHSILIK
jgi:hypothetical protein